MIPLSVPYLPHSDAAPPWPARERKEWGSPGNWTGWGGGERRRGGGGSMEARLSVTMKRVESNTSKISFNILYPSLE